MTDLITAAVATVLATKAVAGLTDAGKAALKALTRLVRRKLAADPKSGDILHDAQADPTSATHRQALAQALAHAMADDRQFSEQLASLWHNVQESRTGTSDGSVLNVASGDINGSLVQARDIHGDITFGSR